MNLLVQVFVRFHIINVLSVNKCVNKIVTECDELAIKHSMSNQVSESVNLKRLILRGEAI